jgi:hypothetical protein
MNSSGRNSPSEMKPSSPDSDRILNQIEASNSNPISLLDIEDVNSLKRSPDEIKFSGEKLTPYEMNWLSSSIDLNSITTLFTQKNWILCPLRDLGLRLGTKKIGILGTVPGHRYVFAIERPIIRQGYKPKPTHTLVPDSESPSDKDGRSRTQSKDNIISDANPRESPSSSRSQDPHRNVAMLRNPTDHAVLKDIEIDVFKCFHTLRKNDLFKQLRTYILTLFKVCFMLLNP